MAKFYGEIGFAVDVEIEPGIWESQPTKRKYYCEMTRNTSKFTTSGGVNKNADVSLEVSILGDPFANENFYWMRYIEFRGAKWEITNVEVKHPRLILTIGGVYNGQ